MHKRIRLPSKSMSQVHLSAIKHSNPSRDGYAIAKVIRSFAVTLGSTAQVPRALVSRDFGLEFGIQCTTAHNRTLNVEAVEKAATHPLKESCCRSTQIGALNQADE